MLILLLSAMALAFAALAIRIYGYFEGETVFLDLLDEWRLSRAALGGLDERNLRNPNKADVVVTLSTIPSRIALMEPTVKSLLRQTRAPRAIVINVPHMSRRENAAYVIPDFLKSLKSVTIVRGDDLGPATKLLPTLAREAADQKILVVDDDRIYPSALVEELERAADAGPDAAYCMSGWIVPADKTDKPTTIWSNFWLMPPTQLRGRRLSQPVGMDVLMGYAGYIVRPRFFDLAALRNFADAPKEAFYVDDLWISAHCNVPRFALPTRRFNYQSKLRKRHYDRTSLAGINRGRGGNEHRNNTIVLRYFWSLWLNARPGAGNGAGRHEAG
jgi:hypothetical protein